MESFEWVSRGYGKNNVKLLHVRREGPVHSIKEYEVCTQLTLDTDKDYIHGDNSDIVATDSQKNTVYILAKKHGVTSPEAFALLLCSHFLNKYAHVNTVSVEVEEYPWRRLVVDGRAHNHAFILSPEYKHTCKVTQRRGEDLQLMTGLEGLRVLKTTQSAFVNFVNDEFRSLPDATDRIFSTIVSAAWQYNTVKNVDFGKIWITILKVINDKFAGPPDMGIFSPSVQNTVYLIQKTALEQIPELATMRVTMPNKHYFSVDFSKFKEVGSRENNEVFLPVDKPSGNIMAVLGRKTHSKL
ncbi:uricase [Cherax quadricarinatus]|uniref:uricase n=1 Tax=Cherax quadricarinatus TaxID=27406 RepID=UPI00387ECC2B